MKTFRCAIYTRKSSEEGLEQEFNSLDAQRESCEAYIKSQAQEGWKLVRKHYDDGGFSGGNIERPGLERLLADIRDGQVDVVVVYKVDRLTRSLTDFAKIVDVFDKAGASFVAVTQHFNTTTSMGRLTLNVLLSFAQFEREVTGERIRDKIAASKKKGMWMGGVPPLGYDVKNRKLIVNGPEATRVRLIFERYLALGNVTTLREDLRRSNVRSKRWLSQKGAQHGGKHFARGALYRMLRNRTYLGEIEYKGQVYNGEHQGIVSKETWEAVQERLDENRRRHSKTNRSREPYLLEGLVRDDCGNIMSPTYAQKGKTRRYRYYVSSPLLSGAKKPVGGVSRAPAQALEDIVLDRVRTVMARSGDEEVGRARVQKVIKSVTVCCDRLEILIDHNAPDVDIRRIQFETDELVHCGDTTLLCVHGKVIRRGGDRIIVGPDGKSVLSSNTPDPKLVRNLVKAFEWRETLERGEYKSLQAVAEAEECTERYVRKLLPLAYLAPDITEAILDGRQPATLELQHLTNRDIPLDWSVQRTQYGFVA